MFYKITMPKVNAGTDEAPDIAYIIVEAPDREHAIFYAGAAFVCGRDEQRFADEFTELTSTITVEDSTEDELNARAQTGSAVVSTCSSCGLPELRISSNDIWDILEALMGVSELTELSEPGFQLPGCLEDTSSADL